MMSRTCSSYGGEKVEDRNRLPLDLALKDVQFKGSLLDRVSSLEHRLSQLCLEMESSSSSGTSTQTSGDNSNSSQGSKVESSFSLSSFNSTSTIASIVNRPISQPHSLTVPEIEETPNREQHSDVPEQKLGKNIKSNKNERFHKNGKKAAPSWPHFKLLGC